jgi:phosphoribosyl 1,2-cyclic phosphate phosphodiesterase
MKILFLGTAASEGWPALFCKCDACLKAKRLGGKNIRTRSSCIIDDVYMVDFPPDTYMHVLTNKLELDKVEHLLITHSHEDHYYPQDIMNRKEPYAYIDPMHTLSIYGNSAVKEGFDAANYEEDVKKVFAFKEIQPFAQFEAGKALVTPLPAAHNPGEQCFVFLIAINGKTLFYGHDSGYYPDQTWDFLKNIHIDAAIFDCTYGPQDNPHGHMGFPVVLRAKDRLAEQGCISEKTTLIITHFSHNGKLLHEELEALASPHGFITAYDGMEIIV